MSKQSELKPGDRYGKLVFIDFVGKVGKNLIGTFKCDCGEEAQKVVTNVINGGTRSCGCMLERTGNRARAKREYIQKDDGLFSWNEYSRDGGVIV